MSPKITRWAQKSKFLGKKTSQNVGNFNTNLFKVLQKQIIVPNVNKPDERIVTLVTNV